MKHAVFAFAIAAAAVAGAWSSNLPPAADHPQSTLAQAPKPADPALDNPAIDMNGFLALSAEAAIHRESRRLTEEQFIAMGRVEHTIILDARSRDKYDLLHIRGAVSLPFTDITVESLARLIPDKNTRILIYCNNNFENEEAAFPRKIAAASLNLSTYVSLYTYGYRNVYELGPKVDPAESKLTFQAAPKPDLR